MSTPHTALVHRILLALPKDRCRAWENPTGHAMVGGRRVRFGIDGQADITGILIDGRRLEIEAKVSDSLRASQRRFRAMIESFGGIYIVAYSVQDVLNHAVFHRPIEVRQHPGAS